MRGTHIIGSERKNRARITPAYAGNTNLFYDILHIHRDHPRVCGEHNNCLCYNKQVVGSPPRMRGTPPVIGTFEYTGRITPAYAGNTRVDVTRYTGAKDHPRVCGEHNATVMKPHCMAGSPPRMRGTLV